jgi:Lrp/AsnC family transcriptional regulator for asnA, asnC and gidA
MISGEPMRIDKLDQELILNLQENGRRANIELAKMLGVSEGTVRARIKKLLDQGIIRITALPELDKLGYRFMSIVGIQVRLANLREVADLLTKNPNVCYLANVTGQYEFIAIVLTKSSEEYANFIENTISPIPSVLRTETFVSLHIYKGQATWLDTTQLVNNIDLSPAKGF